MGTMHSIDQKIWSTHVVVMCATLGPTMSKQFALDSHLIRELNHQLSHHMWWYLIHGAASTNDGIAHDTLNLFLSHTGTAVLKRFVPEMFSL